MRVLLRDGLAVGVLTAVCLVATGILSQAGFHNASNVYVVIDRGMPFAEIGKRFEASGLIKNDLTFLVLGRIFGIEHRAKAGRYRFPSSSNMVDILRTLYKGATYRERILVRPGRTIEAVAGIMSEHAAIDSALFVSLCEDSTFIRGLGVPSTSAEGYLFPATYDVEWREDAASVIRRMVSAFNLAFDDSLRARAEHLGMTVDEAVTLASIIEKEALLEEERPRISAVFHNRLLRGMRLQADPTVRYALKKWDGRVLYRDLKYDSPYNTYKVYGLPPHPICSPGRASMVAAVSPTPGSKDLYFVAQGDGSHYFSRNAGEHLRAKSRYKSYLKSVDAERRAAETARRDSTENAATAADPVGPVEPEELKESISLRNAPGGAR